MKRILNYMWMAVTAMLVAATFTSCLDSSEDNNGLTDEQKAQYATLISGNYRGGLVFYDETLDASKYKNQLDTIKGTEVNFRASDKVITISDFPTRLLVKAVKGHDDLKEALAKTETIDLKMNYYVLDAQNGNVSYFVSPQPVYITLEYGGKTHDLAFAFAQNAQYSYGVYSDKNQSFVFTLAAIYDGKNEKGEYTQMLDNKALLTDDITQKGYDNICFMFTTK